MTRARNAALGLALIAFAGAALQAGKPKLPDLDWYEDFRANEQVARWLLAYDWMAWKSSDLLMQEPAEELAQLGTEWFCYRADDAWHAVYGRYDADSDAYLPAFHYVYREESGVVRTDEPVDSRIALPYGRALRHSLVELPERVTRLGIRFNTYIRSLDDGTLEVWTLPAGQPDGRLVYGGDIRHVFDATGRRLLDTELNFTEFYVRHPDPVKEVNIRREELEVPGVGEIFFILAFGDQVDVTVWTRCALTKLLKVEGSEAWLHSLRETPECKKRRKKRNKQNQAR